MYGQDLSCPFFLRSCAHIIFRLTGNIAFPLLNVNYISYPNSCVTNKRRTVINFTDSLCVFYLKLFIKYMVSNRCKMAVKEELKKLSLHFIVVDLGEVEIMEDINEEQRGLLKKALLVSGLELMEDKKAVLIEKIKNIIIQMVHHSGEELKINFSEYLSKQLELDYTYLSNLFSLVQGTTIEHFIILHKVERIKELIIYDEMNISEIAWEMNYSSVAHLSNQFKKITGLSPSHFRLLKNKRRLPIEEI